MLSKWTLIMSIISLGETLAVNGADVTFPSVTGRNLHGDEVVFPATLSSAKRNVVIVAFLQKQQELVDTWLPELAKISATQKGFHYYELPTLSKLNRLTRWVIYRGMRAGIKDPGARSRTVTLHIDKEPFKTQLGVMTEKDIFLFVVDANGAVRWQTRGSMTATKLKALKENLK